MPKSKNPRQISYIMISCVLVCLILTLALLLVPLLKLESPETTSWPWWLFCAIGCLLLTFSCTLHIIQIHRRLMSQYESQELDGEPLERVGGFARWSYNATTKTLDISNVGFDLLGFPRNSIKTLEDYFECVHPGDRELVEKRFQKQFTDRVTAQYRVINPQCETIWLEVFSEPLFNRQGIPIGRHGVFRDISSSQYRELALNRARSKTEQALELANMVEWEYDPEKRNFKIMEHLGARLFMQPGKYTFTAEEFLARVDGESRQFFIKLLGSRSGKNDSNYTREVRFTRLDGEVFYLRMFGTSLIEDGLICRRFGLLQDITAFRQVERALEESEKEKNLVIDSIDVGLALLYPDHQVIWTNRTLRRMFGKPESNLADKTICLTLWNNQNNACDNCPIQKCVRSRKNETIDFPVEDRVYNMIAAPFIDQYNEITRVIVMISDITEERDLTQQLLHAQKMEAVGQMAGGIAHDFNNILHIILGYCEFAQESCDPETWELLKPINESAHKGHELVRQLLNFSHTEASFNPKHLDLNKTLPAFKEWIIRMIGENIEVNLFINERLPGIRADINQLEQALLNLCVNARDAMPNGGQLTIDAKVNEIDTPLIFKNQQIKPGKYIVISIEDTGTGIPSAALTHIFDPFFTTKDIGKGTGLGLSTVYSVMRKHHGMVQVSSQVDKGSTLQLFFPVPLEEDLDTADMVIAINMDMPESALNILFVEDDPMVRKITRKTLEKAGFTVFTASDGQSAIDLFTEKANTLDIVLLDVVLPRKSGREVYNFIRATRPSLPVIFATGYAAEYLDGIPPEAIVIQKPYSKQDLLRILKRAINTSRESNPD